VLEHPLAPVVGAALFDFASFGFESELTFALTRILIFTLFGLLVFAGVILAIHAATRAEAA